MSSTTQTTASQNTVVGDTLAGVGQLQAVYTLSCGCIIGLIFILASILAYSTYKNDVKVIGYVKSAQCSLVKNGKSTTYNCNITVGYTYQSNAYTGTITESSSTPSYNPGQAIDLMIDPSNPSVPLAYVSPSMYWILLCCGIVIIVGVIGNYYITTHSRIYSQVEGGLAIANVAENIIR